jgi:hypothetical protein
VACRLPLLLYNTTITKKLDTSTRGFVCCLFKQVYACDRLQWTRLMNKVRHVASLLIGGRDYMSEFRRRQLG